MQVGNIECQIAKAQIGNYLAGAGLSEEALTQLEDHLASCADCRQVLADRRAELLALLAEEAQPKAVVDMTEEPSGSAKSIAAALRQKSIEALTKRPEAPTTKPVQAAAQVEETVAPTKVATFWKPLGYSLALGAVLVGMSMFSKNAGNVLGGSVADALPEKAPAAAVSHNPSPVTPPVDTQPKPTAKPVPTESAKPATPAGKQPAKPVSSAPAQPVNQAAPRPQATTKTATSAPTIKKVTVKPISRRPIRSTRKATRRTVRPAKRNSGIRIYDPSGKPL